MDSGEKMRVFLSWSGTRSRLAAEAMRNWLPLVLQNVTAYFTPEDIDKGTRWNSEIRAELSKCDFGIIFLTPENQHSPWILFEAGALSKLESAKVAPVLIDLEPSDVAGPLAQMQLTGSTQDEILKLLKSINAGLGVQALDASHLDRIFKALWDELDQKLSQARQVKITNPAPKRRTDRDLIEEVLERVRAIEMERRKSVDADSFLLNASRIRNVLAHSPADTVERVAVSELPISERAKSILYQHGVFHLKDLINYSELDLLRIPNLGKKSVVEIKEMMHLLGYPLG